MADGKLQIKGTITIKTGKKSKKKRKVRKKKTTGDTSGFTGTGKADTRQEFETPYTTQALMQAMSLRPQIMYAPEQFKAPEMQQPALEQPKYYEFEQYSLAGPEDVIASKKKDIEYKIMPMLQEAEKEKYSQIKERTKYAIQQAEEARQQAEEARQDAEYAKNELRQKQQFMENEMEQVEASFQKRIADLEQVAQSEREKMRLELLGERAKADASIVMEGLLGKIELQAEKEKSQQQLQQAKQEGRKAEIKRMETARLEQEINRKTKALGLEKYKYIAEEGKTKVDVLRDKLIELENLGGVEYTKEPIPRGRPKKEKEEDPVVKELKRQRDLEQQRMSALLEPASQRTTLDEAVSQEDIQKLVEQYTQPEPQKYTEPRDERFGMYMEDIRIKPYTVNEETGQIQRNPRYGLKDWTVKGKSKLWVKNL